MKVHVYAIGVAAVSLALAGQGQAEPFDVKLQSAIFKSKLVQAVDECALPTTLINGVAACPAASATTDGTQFSTGQIIVKSRNNNSQVLVLLKSSGNGGDEAANDNKKALGGKVVQTRLVLRVTKRESASAPSDAVTWQDLVLLCPAVTPDTITGTGNYVKRMPLVGNAGCGLPPALASEAFQKEIVSVSVIDAGSGEAIAVPGVRKRPSGAPAFF